MSPRTVSLPGENRAGPFVPASGPRISEAKRLYAAGVSVPDIARDMDVSERSIYRWLALEELTPLRLGGWVAEYTFDHATGAPHQVTCWRPDQRDL